MVKKKYFISLSILKYLNLDEFIRYVKHLKVINLEEEKKNLLYRISPSKIKRKTFS